MKCKARKEMEDPQGYNSNPESRRVKRRTLRYTILMSVCGKCSAGLAVQPCGPSISFVLPRVRIESAENKGARTRPCARQGRKWKNRTVTIRTLHYNSARSHRLESWGR